jgi:c-di-GMP-related signal transduction protein
MKTTISIERDAENISYTIEKNSIGSYDLTKSVNNQMRPSTFVFNTFQDALAFVRETNARGVKS